MAVTGEGTATVELRQLEVFLAVVEAGTISAAARQLGTAQSAVSTVVRALEEDLGAALFTRIRAHELSRLDRMATGCTDEEIATALRVLAALNRDVRAEAQR